MSSMQKQDLLKRLKCGYVRSVIKDIQVCYFITEIFRVVVLTCTNFLRCNFTLATFT